MVRDARGLRVAGVDGCKGGWLLVTALVRDGQGLELGEVEVLASFAAVLRRTRDCEAVAVDIPIGLSADGRRQADELAKRTLKSRHVCVFYAPNRPLLGQSSHAAANTLSRRLFGKGISQQTFNIMRKVAEADACVTPEAQGRVVEAHPEVSFAALNGDEPISFKKQSREGRRMRLTLLREVFGDGVDGLTRPAGSAWDDLYDACVLAWTASHVAAGSEVHLPSTPERDERGLRMEIVY